MPRPANRRKIKDPLEELLKEALAEAKFKPRVAVDPWRQTGYVQLFWRPANPFKENICLGWFAEHVNERTRARRLTRVNLLKPVGGPCKDEIVSGSWWFGGEKIERPDTAEEILALRKRFDELLMIVGGQP